MKQQDIYEQVTNRIIAQLEQGVIPWKSPYFSTVGFPRNFSTGNRYQGINVFLLASLRYTSPYFLTFIQAKELGGNVIKGEKGSFVVKYGTYAKEIEGAASAEDSIEQRKYLKAYTVFHASQIEGITFPEPEGMSELSPSAACDRARALVAGMPNPPRIRRRRRRPLLPSQDRLRGHARPSFLHQRGSLLFDPVPQVDPLHRAPVPSLPQIPP